VELLCIFLKPESVDSSGVDYHVTTC